ncbi:leucine-rich repeat domain-containing protein [Lachnospiraceae bacterium MD329]|nr:leucine-rich repeat domain-containing protein [Lachnospiraceae bacterium MD329]
MKFLKKIICSILSIALLLSSVTTYAAEPFALQKALNPIVRMLESRNSVMPMSDDIIESGYCGGEGDGTNLTWSIDSNYTLTIKGKGAMADYGSPSAPWYDKYRGSLKTLILNEGVTTIGNNAFDGCSHFTGELILPNSIMSIGQSAFRFCSGFTGELIIPNSVKFIGQSAFQFCSGFTGELTLPDRITIINENTFAHCGFTGNLIIPDSVTTIGNSAFTSCDKFTGKLTIGKKVTTIGNQAFDSCTFTGDLIIPDSVITIGNSAFSACKNLTGKLVIGNSVTSIGTYAFYAGGFTGNLIIPDSVITIGNSAFRGCKNFTGNLFIPDRVTSIGVNAFLYCDNLNDMYILQEEDNISGYPWDFDYYRVHWKYDLSKCIPTVYSEQYVYTGNAIIPDENNITVISPKGKTLYYGTDYTINYQDNVNAGTAKINISVPEGGISYNTNVANFKILPKSADNLRIDYIPDEIFTGAAIMPPVIVTDTERSN